MTAILHATDVLRKDRGMAAMDDNTIKYHSSSQSVISSLISPSSGFPSSGTDWKAKYLEVADMLAETRAELDDFHHSSKELEEELERELERTEKAQQELKVKVARAETERDEWKAKFMSLQTTHNTTTTSLQRELDTLRQEHQKIKIQLRELEMGNDDLERNERAISSSLADVEQKYARALEEKILLEHELLDKANVEEECQRLKDELRDANEESTILKDQLATAVERARKASPVVDTPAPTTTASHHATISLSDEDLLSVPTPSELCLADLDPPPETPAKELPPVLSPRPTNDASLMTPPSVLHRVGFPPSRNGVSTPSNSNSSLTRSATHPGLNTSPSRLRTPSSRPTGNRLPSLAATTASTAGGAPSTAARSKGVQMVSEMRARVKILEQKIHTRVPRLRMGSVTSRQAANAMPPPPIPVKASPSPAPSTSSSSRSARSTSQDDRSTAKSKLRRQSVDLDADARRTPGGDSSGWVLIMEDSPSPAKDKDKERRRTSSPPSAPTAFRPMSSISVDSPPSGSSRAPSALSQTALPTGIRRPQSRLSVSTEGRSSISTNATTSTTSSIPTPSSRPSTPTFLPVPSASLYGGNNLKRSTGPGAGAYGQPTVSKRASLGASTARSPNSRSPTRDSPMFSTSHSNVTVRQHKGSAIPAPNLGQSRIGKPSGRRSGGGSDVEQFFSDSGAPQRRSRSGSTNALYGRHGS
uniref:Structural maintenance of chromosomes protein n=1 Tax=Ganoderma boninense TaxID=34458 RepID=A0A5K1JSS7_9APHY|nr:Structural maintenance of chromosomes protein [Ganoderma boninense]